MEANTRPLRSSLVRALADGLGKGLGLAFLTAGKRDLQASASTSQTSMIAAHDAAFLDDPVFQRRTAMNAVRMQHGTRPLLSRKATSSRP